MRLTTEQKAAFNAAKNAIGIVQYGKGQFRIRHPWKDIGGPSTETSGSYDYITAKRIRAQYVAFYALRELGFSSFEAGCLTDEKSGRAIDIFKAALA